MYVTHRYTVTPQLRAELEAKTPVFGFNGFGEATYFRTYSRQKPDGTQESWADTVIRVVEGVLSIRKDWYIKHGLPVDEDKMNDYANRLGHSIFDMKILPPGRGLWAMGTDYVFERGAMSLNNCAYCEVKKLSVDMNWAMDALMCGVGVGFGIFKENTQELKDPMRINPLASLQQAEYQNTHYQIPDSREGWVESVKLLLQSYEEGSSYVEFDYSQIRPYGSAIRGFGGKASGPEPLIKLHDRVRIACDRYVAGNLSWTRLCADIANSIGACVVAGNVRRCLPEGTNVHTIDGGKAIECVQIGDLVETSLGPKPITNIFDQGMQDTVIIKHGFGEFECTPNHRIAVFESTQSWIYKRADELELGDRLVFDTKGYDGIKCRVPSAEFEKSLRDTMSKTLKIPELTSELAWFVGLFQGDGYTFVPGEDCKTPNGYVSVACHNDQHDIMDRVLGVYGKFDQQGKIESRGNYSVVRCNSTNLAKFLKEHVKQPNTNIEIPEWIRIAGRDIRSAYIAGLFDADGSSKTRPLNIVTTVYRKFAKDIQNLLAGLGIASRFRVVRKAKGNWQELYSITVKGFENLLKINDTLATFSSKYELSRKTMRSHGHTFPKEMCDMNWPNKNVSTKTLTEKTGVEFDYLPVEFLGLEDGRSVKTYDIEVEDAHHFTANGFVVHNSAEILLGNIDDSDFINLKNYDEKSDFILHEDGAIYQCTEFHISSDSFENDSYWHFVGKVKTWPEDKRDLLKGWKPNTFYDGRSSLGWMSNNTVRLERKPEFRQIPKISKLIANNGEPGIMNFTNVKDHARYGDLREDTATGCNPCSEIPLESYELCNLSEVFPTRCKSKAEFYEALELATFYSSTVSLLPTHREETNEVVNRNRRIGVSISGIADWFDAYGAADCIPMMRKGYKIVRKVNAELAKEAGIPESIRVTTVKPSGTISQLVGVSSGMHFPTFQYAIRRMRVSEGSELVPVLQAAGVPWEKDVYSDNTLVFEFPIDQGKTRSAKQVSAWEQFALLSTLQREWADNMVSCTIYFDPKNEGKQLEHMLGQFAPTIKSVSLLPHTDAGAYAQMPYEGITREEYERRQNEIAPIDWDAFGGSDGLDSRFCTNDSCSIVPIKS